MLSPIYKGEQKGPQFSTFKIRFQVEGKSILVVVTNQKVSDVNFEAEFQVGMAFFT